MNENAKINLKSETIIKKDKKSPFIVRKVKRRQSFISNFLDKLPIILSK